jgi:FKBP-type peptidyl-prolyl cis-trans isomerase
VELYAGQAAAVFGARQAAAASKMAEAGAEVLAAAAAEPGATMTASGLIYK